MRLFSFLDTTRAPDLIYLLTIDLKNKVDQSCASKYRRVLDDRFDKLKDYINILMCNKVICPGLSGTGVKLLTRKWVNDGVSFVSACTCVYMCVCVNCVCVCVSESVRARATQN